VGIQQQWKDRSNQETQDARVICDSKQHQLKSSCGKACQKANWMDLSLAAKYPSALISQTLCVGLQSSWSKLMTLPMTCRLSMIASVPSGLKRKGIG
jgi:hypothetical protein